MSSATRIAGRYAKSLIELAQDRGDLEAVTEDIRNFQVAVKNRDLHVMLKSPVIPAHKKQGVIDALFGSYQEITRAFFRIVVDKHREEALPEIADAYLEQYREGKGISVVTLTSATPLEPKAVQDIKDKLLAQGMTGETIELTQTIDPALLGGFVLQVGDQLYDASARTQLNTLRKEFTGNPYVSNISQG